MSGSDVNVTPELKDHPNLRKLARALISLAMQEVEAQAAGEPADHQDQPKPGAAA